MKRILLLFIALFVVLLSSAQKQKVEIIEKSYGPYKAKVLYTRKNPDIAGKKSSVSKGFDFYKKTDTILLKKGMKFGLSYFIKSNVKGNIPIDVEWKYPKAVIGLDKKKYRFLRSYDTKYAGDEFHTGYIIEDDFEMVPGEWRLRLFYGNKKVYERKFYLIEEEY